MTANPKYIWVKSHCGALRKHVTDEVSQELLGSKKTLLKAKLPSAALIFPCKILTFNSSQALKIIASVKALVCKKYSIQTQSGDHECMLSRFCCVWLFVTPWTVASLGSSVLGILQTRILKWVAMPSSRGSSRPRDWTCISCVACTAGGFFTTEPWGKPSWSWGKTKSWGRGSSGSTRRFAELLGSWSSRLGWGSEPRSPMGLCIHNQRRGTPFQTHCQSTLLHLSLPTHCLHRNQSPRRQCLIPGSKPHGCLREEREGLASCAAASDSTQRGFTKRGPGADKRDLGWCNHTHTAKHTHTHNKALV